MLCEYLAVLGEKNIDFQGGEYISVQFLWNSFYRKRLLQQNGDMRKRDLHVFKLHVEQGRVLSPPPPCPPLPTRDKRLAGSVCPASTHALPMAEM